MKRISFIFVLLILWATPVARGQDAATQERLDKLAGQLKDLSDTQEVLQKQIAGLTKELAAVRDQLTTPNANIPSHEELKRLAGEIEKVDQKRAADYERIVGQIENLGKLIAAPAAQPRRGRPAADDTPAANLPEKGMVYTVKANDKLDLIIEAYRKQNIKVTRSDVLRANPGLDPNKIYEGQKIIIPVPK